MAYTALEVTVMAKQMKKGTDVDWSDFGHGSHEVRRGKLKGQTSTDYFEFLCPCCDDGQVMYIVDALQNTGTKGHHESFKKRNEMLKEHSVKMRRCLVHLSLKIYCPECKLTDIVKISNLGAASWNINNIDFSTSEGERS